jgi:hypothetical protein
MKILKTIATGAVLFVCVHQASAQDVKEMAASYTYEKPKLFKELPNRIPVRLNDFDNIFSLEVGKQVTLPLAQNFLVTGSIVSKSEDAAANTKSIVIKASNKEGATLAISRIINEDNTITYRGRMMSFKHADAYEIGSENGSYYLAKKGSNDLYEE